VLRFSFLYMIFLIQSVMKLNQRSI
jgi:hypothetical protein